MDTENTVTELLYIIFYVWLVGLVLTGLLYFAALKIIGGRQNFAELLNKIQGKNYNVNHIDWAIVIGVVFWPSTLAQSILQRSVNRQSASQANDG